MVIFHYLQGKEQTGIEDLVEKRATEETERNVSNSGESKENMHLSFTSCKHSRLLLHNSHYVCVCMCVCVCERQ